MNKLFIIVLLGLISKFSGAQEEWFPIIKEAEPVGGKSEFNRFFKQELIYPESSLNAGVGGKTIWIFKVSKEGEISDFKLISSVNEELDREALRLIKLLQWKPAENEGYKLESFKNFPLIFNPGKYKSICKKRGYNFINYPHQPYDSSLVIYEKVNQAPKFKEDDLSDFLRNNLKYPKEAAVRNISGTVLVSFIVEPSGMVTNINIEQHVGGGCTEEAIRLVGLTKWKPGIKNGMAVRTRMKLPIVFNINQSIKDGLNQEQRTR